MPSSDELLHTAESLRQKAALAVLNQNYNRSFRLPPQESSNTSVAL
jgi:hypothetical protein